MKIKELLSVKTLTPEQLAKKHKVDISVINSQLKKGIKVEMEHTDDPKIAREIALDQIREYVDYYDRLKKVER